jgi:pyrroloquinoline quinone biosynthesis protein D
MTDAATPSVPTAASVPSVGPGFRLQWEPVQDAHVLLFPEGMIKLNQSGGEIMKRCDGLRSVAQIVAELEQAFSAQGLIKDVLGFVQLAGEKRWLRWE